MCLASEKVSAPDQSYESVDLILEKNGYQPNRLITILQAVQEEYRYLPEDVLYYVAQELKMPAAKLFGVATFYSHFALEPRGKNIIRLCDGTACHVKQSIPILEALYARLGLSEKKKTSEDMMFTIETVACLGACGLAPVMIINEEVHGQVTPKSAVALVEELIAKEANA
jgi:NADH-quinone oxidoreductase subunit E